MKATTMLRLLVVWFALPIIVLEANVVQRTARGARCTPLDPSTDSIPHPDSHPDCKVKPYPDYFSRCTCSYFVARKLNGCPSHFFVLCTKADDPRAKRPQVSKLVQQPIRRAEILPPTPLAAGIVDEASKNIFVPVRPAFSLPATNRPVSTTASTTAHWSGSGRRTAEGREW